MDIVPPMSKKEEKFTIADVIDLQEKYEEYYIQNDMLKKRIMVMDICYSDSERSCCFTKSYGRYVTGTGSVYTHKTKAEADKIFETLKNFKEDSSEYLICISSLGLRFFTPREVCRLMCFPENFTFPTSVTNKQKYMLLGNSINIRVVSELIKLLTT